MTRVEASPGLLLNVEDSGNGPPLILLHGFMGSSDIWGPMVERLGDNHRVMAVDIVGHGKSDAPHSLKHYRMEQVAVDIVGAIGKLGGQGAAWLGYSMGGRTALAIAALHPEAVERLCLVGASPGLRTQRERASRRKSDTVLADRIIEDGLETFVGYWESLSLFASQQRLPVEIRDRIRQGRLANRSIGLANSLRGMGAGKHPSFWGRLPAMDIPVLLVAGEEDRKYSDLAREMASSLPNGRVSLVPEAGHAAHVENLDFCAAEIRQFLTKMHPEKRP